MYKTHSEKRYEQGHNGGKEHKTHKKISGHVICTYSST